MNLDTDIYALAHLETPKNAVLPGTSRQRKWIMYLCGWVSKERVLREGVYLPRHSLSERGQNWMQYRGQEIEFYNRNLNGLNEITDLLTIESTDVAADVQKEMGLDKIVKPILHSNQYFHLLKWLKEKEQITDSDLERARAVLTEELYDGL